MNTLGKFDVIVCGGGPAGIGAAIGAARNGAKTLILEQFPFLGGCATHGLPLLNFHTMDHEKILDGIPQEFVDRLMEVDGVTNHIPVPGHISSYTLMDPESVKYVAQKMMQQYGVEILYHSAVIDVLMECDKVVGVVLQNVQGQHCAFAGSVIDSTGDGDVVFKSGAEMRTGSRNGGKTQAATMTFKLGNVDTDRMTEWINRDVQYARKPWDSDETFLRGWGTFGRWDDILRELNIFADEDHQIFTNSMRRGELSCNTVKVLGFDPTDTVQLSQAEVAAREKVWELWRFMREHCPGFENSYIISTPVMIGIRESRRIVGEYELQPDDVLQGRKFADVVARGAYTIDIHDPLTGRISFQPVGGDGSYDIPYGCFVPKAIDGLLASGRLISASHEALGSCRVMGICMAGGEAAGTAAALAAKKHCAVRELDVGELQSTLVAQNVNLGRRES